MTYLSGWPLVSRVRAINAGYGVTAANQGELLDVTASGGDVTISLAAVATLANGFHFFVMRNDASDSDVIIDPDGAETINGSATYTLTQDYECIEIIGDGAEWFIVGVWTGPHDSINQTVAPAPDGVTTVFTVAGSSYTANTLRVFVNGQLQTANVDFVETTPASGTFTFQAGSVPDTGDIIRVDHGNASSSGNNNPFISINGTATTTDATTTAASTIALSDETTYHFDVVIIAIQSGGSNRGTSRFSGTVYRTGGGGATLQGTNTSLHTEYSDGTWGAVQGSPAIITVSGNNMVVSVEGKGATTINWKYIVNYSSLSN